MRHPVRRNRATPAGVVPAGVVPAGVVLAGVVPAGVVLAGIVLAGIVLAGMVLAGGVARAQDSAKVVTARVAPAYFSGNEARSVGVSWDVRLARAWSGAASQSTTPSATCRGIRPVPELTGELATDGGAALDPDANSTPLRAGGRLGLWWSLYRPACPSPNPLEPPRGGWYFGSAMLSAHAEVEGNQRLTEMNALFGADLLWTHSRATGAWRYVPSLRVTYSAAVPVRPALRDSLAQGDDVYRRGEVHAAWHVPLAGRLRLHANVRGWKSSGLSSSLARAGAEDGMFTAFDLAYGGEWRLAGIAIPELFVRRVDGEVPEDWRQRRTWMIGIVTGK